MDPSPLNFWALAQLAEQDLPQRVSGHVGDDGDGPRPDDAVGSTLGGENGVFSVDHGLGLCRRLRDGVDELHVDCSLCFAHSDSFRLGVGLIIVDVNLAKNIGYVKVESRKAGKTA